MKHHPFATLFPMQTDEEIQSLADDIARHGLRQPIVIDADEMILDGRNRSAACAIAGVQPVYEPFVGNDAEKLAYVVSVNVHRRHLTTAQRAEIAATIATMKPGENQHTGKKKKEDGSNELPSKPVTTEQAAKLMNVSVASVKRAKAKASPTKAPEIVGSGKEKKPASSPKAATAAAEPEAEKKSMTVTQIQRTLMKIGRDKKRHPQLMQIATDALYRLNPDERCGFLASQLKRLTPEQQAQLIESLRK